MKRYIVILLTILAVNCSFAKFKSCGAADCPLNHNRYLGAGFLQFGLTHEYINQDQIYVGSSSSFVGAIPSHHDEVQTLNERNVLQVQMGIADRFNMGIDVPFVHREHSHIHHDNGEDLWETWNFSGLGDMRIIGEYALILPGADNDAYLSASAGVKVPSGVTDARNGEGEEAEVTIQPGTGSVDGIFRLNYRQQIATVPTLGGVYSSLPIEFTFTYQTNGRGKDEYRFGNMVHVHVGTAYQFAKRASLLLQLNTRFQEYADVGLADEPRENTGGTWVFVSPGIGVQLSDAFSGSAFVQIPAYRNVHGIQQTSRLNLSFSLSYSLDILSVE